MLLGKLHIAEREFPAFFGRREEHAHRQLAIPVFIAGVLAGRAVAPGFRPH